MKSLVVKRSIFLAGRKTSVSLEDEFWNALKKIASDRYAMLSELVGDLDAQRQHGNLSSALRLFVLEYYRGRREKPGDEMLGQQSPPSAPVLCKRDLRYLFCFANCSTEGCLRDVPKSPLLLISSLGAIGRHQS